MKSKTELIMAQRGLRYFSSLTPKQKDKSVLYTCGCIVNDLTEQLLPIYRQIYNPDLAGCKMFWFPECKVWIPLNINDFINNKKS